MGISGLLPLLKSIHKHCNLKKFAGQTIGIDGYGWLHRGTVACAIELALDKPTTKYVDFAVSRVRMLLDFGITPYVVFDGDALPSKAGTNAERRARREEAKELGLQLYRAGKQSQAQQELQKAAGVSPQMARQFIDELKRMDVQYIVAPYEADAQLAYLECKGIINGILSEDSDLLVFGAKRLITKLNQYGECVEIERKDFPLCKEINLAGWTDAMFRRMAILSGCDYLPSIDKMGLKTAYRFIRKYKDAEKAIRMIAFEGKFCVPVGYVDKFRRAELTFLHHRVFCPIEQKMVFLTDLDRGMEEEDMPYLGIYVEPEIAIGVACGDLNPKTKEPLESRVSFPGRPQLKEHRRQTLGTPFDLKPKSIDSFFKAQRTPLAELDPNSLTPSPSQQRLLQRNRNASWESRPISSAPQLRRTVTAVSATPTITSTNRRDFLTRASTISNYQPPKRQRLCSEADDVSPSKEIKTSPFFSSVAHSMSPLDQKKSKSRKSRREFDVWSDDSTDDILLGLPDVQQTASPVGQNGAQVSHSEDCAKQFSADSEAIPQSSPVRNRDDSQSSLVDTSTDSQVTVTKSANTSQETTATTVSFDDNPEAFEDLLEYHVRKQNETLARTFSSQSATQQQLALKSLRPQQLPEPVAGKPATEKEESLKVSAIITQSPAVGNIFSTFVYQSPERQKSALQSIGPVQTNATKVELARTALAIPNSEPSDQALVSTGPATKVSHHIGPIGHRGEHSESVVRGSEDALVANSEDEASEEDDRPSRPSLNLGAFVFQA